jgi:2,4-dienoyl-CoA reductase-like NADH-dependent reductase (Old Yellow Enzyme family)
MTLFSPLTLPNGTVLPNRIAKAAMEENMADSNHAPSVALLRLYETWAEGGAGLILTGNVMVDKRAMTGPGGVVLENDTDLNQFCEWAKIAKSKGAQIWMQINHPGRQMQVALGQPTLSPSGVPLDMGTFSKKFPVPKVMSIEDIKDVKSRFIKTAQLAETAGFSGVQIHAAHGYLISQFLSPLTNLRQDEWGGNLENRARLLIEIVEEIRSVVDKKFSVSVKLNSADFQRGGFSLDDAEKVISMLNETGVDLIELSGGSFEAPAMQGQARDGRTLAREAYFLEFASQMLSVATVPLMLTGGIKRPSVAETVIGEGIAVVGIATALAIEPNLPNQWRDGIPATPTLKPINWKNKVLASLANMAVVKHQLKKHSLGKPANTSINPIWALVVQQLTQAIQSKKYRKWVSSFSA